MKEKVFWYHYNKPASSKRGKPQITVHYNKICHLVDNVVVNVPTYGHIRNDQPRFVVKGKCKKLDIRENIAYIE